MNDFDYEVMQRKNIAGQARHRKCGSKSKKCPLSTDRMTNKQWKERCGKPMVYQFGKPMTWEEFSQLPIHIQKEYMLNLIEKYSATASDFARMFGIHPQTVTKHCKRDDIAIKFTPGKRMSKDEREAFNVFCSGVEKMSNSEEKEIPVNVVQPEKEPVVENANENKTVDINKTEPSKNMQMTEFSLCFDGLFSRSMVYNSISSMLPEGTNVRMELKCSIVP